MPKVGIVMGSDSDMPVMSKAAEVLDKLGVSYEMRIISAHREPDEFFEYAKTAEEKGSSAGYVRCNLSDACYRNTYAHHFPWRKRFFVQHSSDAFGYSCCNCCH